MIVYQVHHMWYESNMIDECWHSLLNALRAAPDVEVKIKICFNFQTYIEEPEVEEFEYMLKKHTTHPLFRDYKPEVTIKTNDDPFYNIADWRREVYDPDAKYTVWGELRGYSKRCQCNPHKDDCIELLESPWKYKDYITQEELDKFNDESGDIKIQQVPHKLDGSTVCLSGGIETPFIAPGMHFVREDTCLEYFLRAKGIPQVCITTRLKGHNYKHPHKRVGTNATRNDEVFKKYADESIKAMNKFLSEL